MRPLADATVAHLRSVIDTPDFGATRYANLTHLADGGMGSVYRALDRELGRPVAIKLLRAGRDGPAARERLLREARVIAGLEHPGIVPIHDVGTLPDGRVYYVMKLVQGRRLDQFCAGEPDVIARLRVFERICETVAFAHARGVLHRDLKPQNIMVGSFGEVLVLDWGIARVRAGVEQVSSAHGAQERAPTEVCDTADAETKTRLTCGGAILGTLGYMAPEQARGDLDEVDERSDVYALGAILNYLLTGRRREEHGRSAGGDDEPPRVSAPGDQHEPAVCQAAMPPGAPGEQRPLPVRHALMPRTLSKALAAVCLTALAAEKRDRYPSAAALGADVARVVAGQIPAVYREGWLERLRRLAWQYRVPILLVLAYLLMRCALIFWRTA